MASRIRAVDWSTTSLGPIEDWPIELQTTLALCLNTDLPTAIYWGDEMRLLYNDAWSPIAGEKHPWALGRPASTVWADIWDIIKPQLMAVVETGKGFRVADQMLPMLRGGRVQHTHWDYSFAPIFSAEGRVVGVFNQGTETTARLSAQRALRASEERLEYALGASETVGTWDWDIPNDSVVADARFAKIYGVERSVAASGAPIGAFFRLVHPDDLPALQSAIDEALKTGTIFSQEYRLVDADGSVRWVTAKAASRLRRTVHHCGFRVCHLTSPIAALSKSRCGRARNASVRSPIRSTR